ncbi:MAG: pentapeptide repeat-containing protein [Sphingomonadaceae bacterium]|nr:pentapeptide repeat-containing protein [Sphingomonadaceae bacterium]
MIIIRYLALLVGAGLAASGTAHAAETGSCADYIASMPREPYDPPDATGDDDDHTYAWFEPSNDNVVSILDGKRITSPAELIDQLYKSGSPLHVIAHADFTGWDFRKLEVPLTGLCFYRSKLAGSRWDGRDLSRGAFVESDLTSAHFAGSVLEQVLIRDSRLASTDMSEADLSGGKLDGGWFKDLAGIAAGDDPSSSLQNWRLHGARLDGFTFDCGIEVHNGCPLDRTIDFSGASLSGADLSRFPGWGQFNLDGAQLDRTLLALRQLPFFVAAEFAGPLVLAGRSLEVETSPAESRELLDIYAASEKLREGPALDCKLADQPVERMICSEDGEQQGLWLLDRRMATAFAAARQRDPRVADVQKAWLRLRAQCKTHACLTSVYEKRLTNLLATAGVPAWLAPGESALYVEEDLAPDRRFHDRAVVRKVLPVLADSAMQTIVVVHDRDGGLAVLGRALGANGHSCYLGVESLWMDPASGWLALHHDEATSTPAIRLIGDEIFVIGDGKPDSETWPDADFVSCGARASFLPGAYVPVDQAIIDEILQDAEY